MTAIETVEGIDLVVRIQYMSGLTEYVKPPEATPGSKRPKLTEDQFRLYADYVRSLHNEMRTVEVVRFTYIKREEVV